MIPRTLNIPIRKSFLDIIDNHFNKQKKINYKEGTLMKVNVVYLIFLLRNLQYSYRKKGSCFPIHTPTLQKTFLKKHKHYLLFLEDCDILINVVEGYIVGKQSKLYSLKGISPSKKDILEGATYFVNDKKIINRIFKLDLFSAFGEYTFDDEVLKNMRYCKHVRNHLVKNFDKKMNIDVEQAYTDIGKLNEDEFFKQLRFINQFQYKKWKYSIKTESDNRLQTPLVRLKKNLLEYVRYNNLKLGEIDVQASQPMFLYLVFKSLFFETKETEITKFLNEFLGLELIKKIKKVNISTSDFKLYERLILKEDIYRYFADSDKLKFKTEKVGEDTLYSFKHYKRKKTKGVKPQPTIEISSDKRDLVKILFMKVLYGNKRNHPLVITISNEFPTLFNVIDIINEDITIQTTENNLSKLLQNLEAYVVLDLVAKDISKVYKNIPLFSKHDAIITYQKSIVDIKVIAEKSFKTYTNIEKDEVFGSELW